MKILVDLTSLTDNFSGIERFALSITKKLIKNKEHKWLLLFKNSIHREFIAESDNVEKIVIKGHNKLIFNQFILPIKLLSIKVDRYFFPAFPAPFLFFGKNSFSTIHDLGCWDCPGTNKSYMIFYFKIMYRKAALNNKKLVTVSEFSKNRICSILHVEAENVSVIYNGVDSRFFNINFGNDISEKYNLPKKYLLCLSTLEPRKNLPILIHAYANVCDQLNLDLVLAGRKGWMMDNVLFELPENIKNRIHFTGFIDDEDLPYIYSNATWFVFPSIYEGFGIPPVESMATGTPVISSNAASMPEVLGEAAVYFENNNLNDLSNKLLQVSKENIQSEQIKKCINQARKYSWESSAQKLMEYLKN